MQWKIVGNVKNTLCPLFVIETHKICKICNIVIDSNQSQQKNNNSTNVIITTEREGGWMCLYIQRNKPSEKHLSSQQLINKDIHVNKCQIILKGQSKMEKSQKMATQGIQNENKNKTTTHYVLDVTMHKRTYITYIRHKPSYKQLLDVSVLSLLLVPCQFYWTSSLPRTNNRTIQTSPGNNNKVQTGNDTNSVYCLKYVA